MQLGLQNMWFKRRGKAKMSFVSEISVPCDCQLPPSMEHAAVLAVWDWGVQGHLPLHLCPEKLFHWWVRRTSLEPQRRIRKIHETFFCRTDLIQDWASDNAPDIYSFVPYSWTFKILFHQFEMIWAGNQHNWIDCSTKQQENGEEFMLVIIHLWALKFVCPWLLIHDKNKQTKKQERPYWFPKTAPCSPPPKNTPKKKTHTKHTAKVCVDQSNQLLSCMVKSSIQPTSAKWT